MTTELEKQFFDTFGIEPYFLYGCRTKGCPRVDVFECTEEKCRYFVRGEYFYPEITVGKLYKILTCFNKFIFKGANISKAKEVILEYCIKHINDDNKQQVQALFKEK